jgi:hypothetical protein
MITSRHLVLVAFLLMSLTGLIHAQDKPKTLKAGFYEAEDIDWLRDGEWVRKTENDVTWYTSATPGSWRETQVEGKWIVLFLYPEYGTSKRYIFLNGCVQQSSNSSVHDVPYAVMYALDGPTTVRFQIVEGRSGLDAIEIDPSPQRWEAIKNRGGIQANWIPGYYICQTIQTPPPPVISDADARLIFSTVINGIGLLLGFLAGLGGVALVLEKFSPKKKNE